ncbi:NADH-cytochrome b5 reductase-like protein [Trypanosoma equiperdum]|uniref:NADH-cytochrome b5 reductase-like protein n=1 Tax=Trypanosoma equiperdum TaxID=5694 RepID=A0A1G4IET5_TRYEQ|nr:NADH-cytochrome b5 reductase-like protein [Trypanosoma equiperdum]
MDPSSGNGGGTSSSGFSTFSDSKYHEARRRKRQQLQQPQRWSYTLQDIPGIIRKAFNDVNTGYAARVAAFFGVTTGVSFSLYKFFFVRLQNDRPLAKRSRFTPHVPVTLLDKERIKGTDMFLFRFALPNSYDYCGYEPISSVQVTTGTVRSMTPVTRWFTPTSHPQQRGIIEFAVKERDPGRMAARLRSLQRGEQVYLGRWMREFPYQNNTYGELGLICTTSGASIALQLMNVMDKDKQDNTQLKFLYCHHTAKDIPFRSTFEAYAKRNPGRISVKYDVMSLGRPAADDGLHLGENVFLGHIDPTIVRKTLPPPVVTNGETGEPVRPKILICGPQRMLLPLCGRVNMLGNYTYWQGPFYKYCGFLKDMGYLRNQVYKFGVSTHLTAYQ